VGEGQYLVKSMGVRAEKKTLGILGLRREVPRKSTTKSGEKETRKTRNYHKKKTPPNRGSGEKKQGAGLGKKRTG